MKTELPVRLADQIAAFLADQKPKVTEQGYSSIEKLVRQVGAWLAEAELEPAQVGIGETLAWQAKLATRRGASGRPLAAGTINNHLKAARRFFDYLVKTDQMDTNPLRALRRVKVGEHLSDNALTVEQMGKLLEGLARFDELTPMVETRQILPGACGSRTDVLLRSAGRRSRRPGSGGPGLGSPDGVGPNGKERQRADGVLDRLRRRRDTPLPRSALRAVPRLPAGPRAHALRGELQPGQPGRQSSVG